VSSAPVEKVFLAQGMVEVRRPSPVVLTALPASTVEQKPSPSVAVNLPWGQTAQVEVEPSPLLPATHISHVVGELPTVLLNSPEEHVVQDEAPWLLKLAPSHGVHESVAPVEKVLEGHVSMPVLSALAFVPAPFVEQNAEPAEEKLPVEVQTSQAANEAAPLSLNVPAGQGTSATPFE